MTSQAYVDKAKIEAACIKLLQETNLSHYNLRKINKANNLLALVEFAGNAHIFLSAEDAFMLKDFMS